MPGHRLAGGSGCQRADVMCTASRRPSSEDIRRGQQGFRHCPRRAKPIWRNNSGLPVTGQVHNDIERTGATRMELSRRRSLAGLSQAVVAMAEFLSSPLAIRRVFVRPDGGVGCRSAIYVIGRVRAGINEQRASNERVADEI